MQIFSGCVCHFEQLHAQSPFLFPIVFGIKFDSFFRYLLSTCCTFTRGCSGLCSFTWATARSQLLLFMVLAGGFWCFTAGCHVKSPLFPQSPLKQGGGVLHDWRKHTRPSFFHNPTLSANKHVVQICRSSLSAAVQTVQVECRTSPFNGIERSLSHAVVIKTIALPVSATTFPTALSLYIAHDGKNISTIQRSPQISTSYKFAAPRYRLPPMALQTVQVSVQPRLSTTTHKAETALKNHSVVS